MKRTVLFLGPVALALCLASFGHAGVVVKTLPTYRNNPYTGRQVVTGGVYNPYTGARSSYRNTADFRTGARAHTGVTYNPYTGITTRRHDVYNPWTGAGRRSITWR